MEEQISVTVEKLKGIFDVTNMISTFGEVALVTKKIQTNVRKTFLFVAMFWARVLVKYTIKFLLKREK